MKKLITRTFIIIILIFTIYGFKGKVYGKVCNGGWTLFQRVYSIYDELTATSNNFYMDGTNILDSINLCVTGDKYQADTLTNHLVFKATVRVLGKASIDNYFSVFLSDYKLGSQYEINQNEGLNIDMNGGISLEDIMNKLGCERPEEDLISMKEPISWDIIIEAEVPERGELLNNEYKKYSVNVENVYSGNDMKNPPSPGGIVEIFDGAEEKEPGFFGKIGENWRKAKNAVEEVWDFTSHPLESIINLFLDFIREVFGDFPQRLANIAQTGFKNWKLCYDIIDFTKEENDSSTGKHADLDVYVDINDQIGLKKEDDITIKKDDKNLYGFTYKTKIPVISVDLYTLAADKVDFVKANFLEKTGNETDIWLIIRNFVASLIHGFMYVIAAFLIMGLIVNGIYLVTHTFTSPKEKQNQTEILQNFAMGVIMLVGTIVIEALCIYSCNLILKDVNIEDTYEGPIRVNVEEAGYSFSTTPTGYIRYMAEMENLDRYEEKALYVIEYVILAWSNLICLIAMVLRMIMMMFLAVFGFVVVLKNVLSSKTTSMLGYKTWVIVYASIAAIQIVLAIIAKLILTNVK